MLHGRHRKGCRISEEWAKGKKNEPRADYPTNNMSICSSEWSSRGCRPHPGCQLKRIERSGDRKESPAISRADRTFEPGYPGGTLTTASGFLLHGRRAHHSRGRFPFFECWLKKLPSITRCAGYFPCIKRPDRWLSEAGRSFPPILLWSDL